MPSEDQSKEYRLIYWPGIPGRGEHVRLCFEATKTPYSDVSNEGAGVSAVLSLIGDQNSSDIGLGKNIPPLAPPILRHGDLVISQTSNILLYLGLRLGLVDAEHMYTVNQLALTALDGLSDEAHDVHHPVSVALAYEDQKDVAAMKARQYRNERLPKFLAYFERVLESQQSNTTSTETCWLVGSKMTYADLVLFQCLNGVSHAFPRAIKNIRDVKKSYGKVWALYEAVKALPAIKEYLQSKRRLPYSNGIYRHYEELDPDE